jgi:hypothetical protein
VESFQEQVQRLAGGQVQTASTSHEELPAHRGHPVEDLDSKPALTQDLGRHQAGRSASYDGDVLLCH